MKKLAMFVVLALMSAPLFAQDDKNHGEVGAFFDFLRLNDSSLNNYGIGGRLGFNVHPNVQLEAEGAYDFRQTVSQTVAGGLTPGTVTSTFPTDVRITHGLFGFKIHNNGPFKIFMVAKGGFINFSIKTSGSVPTQFTNTFNGIVDGDTHPVFYPGVGVEAFAGWFGLRGEVGDEMFFNGGVNHSLRITVGPQFRF